MSTTTITPGLRACPDCYAVDLSIRERLLADVRTGGIRVEEDGTLTTDYIETLVDYDSGVRIGVSCECGWSYDGDDWLDQLVERAGRAADAKIDYVVTRDVRTVKAVEVEIRQVVWTDGSRSYEVYRTSDDKNLTAAECFDTMPDDEQIANVLELLDWQDGKAEPGDQFAYSIQVPAGRDGAYYLIGPESDGTWSLELCQTSGDAERLVSLGRFPDEEAAKTAAQVAEEGYRARAAKAITRGAGEGEPRNG